MEVRSGLHLEGHSEGLAATIDSIGELLWLHHLSRDVSGDMLLLRCLKERPVKAWLVATRKISLGLEVLLGVLMSVVKAQWETLAREPRLTEGLLLR